VKFICCGGAVVVDDVVVVIYYALVVAVAHIDVTFVLVIPLLKNF
jgi:hypothetical protein